MAWIVTRTLQIEPPSGGFSCSAFIRSAHRWPDAMPPVRPGACAVATPLRSAFRNSSAPRRVGLTGEPSRGGQARAPHQQDQALLTMRKRLALQGVAVMMALAAA